MPNFLAEARDRRHGGIDGNGVAAKAKVTYRHLLSSQSMTTSNPLRVIAHCDVDAAYAQFEMVRLNIPEDQPLCVQQWSGLIAVNYPARKYDITRHMDVHEARKKCPNLQTVHVATFKEGETEPGYWGEVDPKTHKVSLDPYRRESAKILAVFKSLVPEGEVEKASIDEAFIDLTALTIQEILKIYPELANVPDESPLGLDTPLPEPPRINWRRAGNVIPLDGQKAEDLGDVNTANPTEGFISKGVSNGTREEGPPQVSETEFNHESNQIDQAKGFKEPTGSQTIELPGGIIEELNGWEDVALCIGAELMDKIRDEVRLQLGYTTSAGIAHNKTLSKLCSAWKKPNAQTVLRQAAVPAFLSPLPFNKIRNLGGKLGAAIESVYGATTVGDLLTVSLKEMQDKFGEESIWVYNILRGIDHTPVKERLATKSMLASKNIQPSVTTREAGYHWLNILAGELYVRLRDARDITEGLWPKTLVLGHRQGGYETSRSRQTAFPYTRNLSTDYIAKYANRLWDEVTEPMTRKTHSKSLGQKFNNLSLSFSGLERLEGGQKGIEGFLGKGPSTLLKRERSASVGPSEVNPKTNLQSKKQKVDPDVIDLSDDTDDNMSAMAETWTCDRCMEVLGAESEEKLTSLRQEHGDLHMAKDLYNAERKGHSLDNTRESRSTGTTRGKGKANMKSKTNTKAKGIQAFFQKHP